MKNTLRSEETKRAHILGQSDQLKKKYCVNRTRVHGHPKEIQAHSTLGTKRRSLIQLKYVEPMRKN